jgi:DNA helicase-2/ATP-dependent DNA helicase PcrA
LDHNPEIKQRLQQRFQAILVDEYQDSNVAQFELLKRLNGDHTYLCVVGDDDQSIYRFRGAEIQNIIQFPEIFENTTIIRLEQNYRSTQHILSVASSVVANNQGRLGKTLWTDKDWGPSVVVRFFADQRQEVEYCAQLLEDGMLGETAILYRTNAQSREFELFFSKHNIPYRLVGTISFYSREEIKDMLAWLALLVNPKDELAFRRIVNKPSRGIGDASIKKIIAAVPSSNGDLFSACRQAQKKLSSKAYQGVDQFLSIFRELNADLEAHTLDKLLKQVMLKSGLLEYYKEQDHISHTQKTKNLDELVTAAMDYSGGREGLVEFLEAMELDRAQIESHESRSHDGVTLITMHNTKGLEFDRVIITGLEEGIFPGFRNESEEDLEEERRIFYVSLTRARKELYLTCAKTRRIWGRIMHLKPSRFLDEVPKEYLDLELPDMSAGGDNDGYHLGTVVYHDDFGTGIICKRWYNGS